MRTGFSLINEEQTNPDELYLILMAFIVHVAEKATERSVIYAKHKGFMKARAKDMVRSMKYTAMSILNQPDFMQRILAIKEEIRESADSLSSDSEDSESSEEGEQSEELEFGPSNKCYCEICNDTRRFSNNWEHWKPTHFIQVAMRNAINRAIADQMIDV